MIDTTARDLIQRMAKELDLYRQMARDDCTSTHPFADEARAYLAQPEPEGLTDEEIDYEARKYLVNEYASPEEITYLLDSDEYEPMIGCFRAVIAADRARWGRPAVEPKGPTESDLSELFYRYVGEGSEVGFENAIAEALTRWGRP